MEQMILEIRDSLQERMSNLKWKLSSLNLIASCLINNQNRLYVDMSLINIGVLHVKFYNQSCYSL